jgi:hypothetical protein
MRFRRALDCGNVTEALSAASELQFVSLADALELTLLPADGEAGEVRAGGRSLARPLCSGGPARQPAREPGGARSPRRDPGEPPRCGRAGRTPRPATILRANRRGPCSLVAGGVELRRASALEVRRGRLARDLPVAHPSRVARRAGDRPLAPRATNTCVHGGVGAVDGLSGAADAPASPRIVVASGLMNMHGALDTGWRSPRKRLLAVGARLLARKG